MKSYFSTVLILITVFSLQSCASFKPNDFDDQTRRYNNYKRNYSIEILEGYSLLSEAAKTKIKKSHFPNEPHDTIIFFDKTNRSLLAMWAREISLKDFNNNKKEAIRSLADSIKEACKSSEGCKNIDVSTTNDTVTTEVDVVSELGDGKSIITATLHPLSNNPHRTGLHSLLGTPKLKNFEKFKAEYLIMLKSLQFPAFSEAERKRD